jgi:hypothetical protein
MVELAKWNTVQTAAKWLSEKTGRDLNVQNILSLCGEGNLRIMAVPKIWKEAGKGELTWFDEAGQDLREIYTDGWIAMNQAMCSELIRKDSANLKLATMSMVNTSGESILVAITRDGSDLPDVSIDDLRIGKLTLEKFAADVTKDTQQADTTGMVAWQAEMLTKWPEIVNAGCDNGRKAIAWLKKNGAPDVFERNCTLRDEFKWIDGSGKTQTVTIKTVQSTISAWRKQKIISKKSK